MLYAIREDGSRGSPDDHRQRAVCPCCGLEVIGRFSSENLITPNWAHPNDSDCDPWSEGETPWHLGWKSIVKPEQCEVTMKRDGEHHRADIEGDRGVVIELQHSPISPEVIREREVFYGRMIWVFDASDLVEARRVQQDGYLNDSPCIEVTHRGDSEPGARRVLTEPREEDWPFGHGLVRPWEPSERLWWKHRKKSWWVTTAPVFLDFGQPVGWDPWVALDEFLVPSPEGPSMFEVRAFQGSGRLVGRFIDRRDFLRRFLGNSLRPEFLEGIQFYHQERWDRVSRFLLARRLYRRQEEERRAEEERQRQEAKRREEERREAERRRREEARQRYVEAKAEAVRDQARMSFDDLTMLYRRLTREGYSSPEGRAESEAFREVGQKRLAKLKQVTRNQLSKEDACTLRRRAEENRAQLEEAALSTNLHKMRVEGDLVIVNSQYDDEFRPRIKRLRFRWNPPRGWVGSVTHKEAVRKLVDECNEKLLRWRFPRLAFVELAIEEALEDKGEPLVESEEEPSPPEPMLLPPEEWKRRFAEYVAEMRSTSLNLTKHDQACVPRGHENSEEPPTIPADSLNLTKHDQVCIPRLFPPRTREA